MIKLGIGERLKKLRETNKLTQLDLAKVLKITHQSISKWERNESIPDTLMVVELSKVFSVSTDYLLLGKTKGFIEVDSSNFVGLKVNSIGELSHEALLALYSTVLVKNMTDNDRSILQGLGFVSVCNDPEWTIEGMQLSQEYWYNCCEVILKELNAKTDIDAIYLTVNRQIEIPKKLFYRFIDELVSIGKINRISQLFTRNGECI